MGKIALVVDDDKKIVILLEKLVKNLGFETYTAEDGKTALELLKEFKPDLLISDMLLPGVHGAELCNIGREFEDMRHCKVILMTAVYSESNLKLDMQVKPDEFIAKPFSMKDMANLIGKLKDW